jgi:hypothetical protein
MKKLPKCPYLRYDYDDNDEDEYKYKPTCRGPNGAAVWFFIGFLVFMFLVMWATWPGGG